MLFKTKLIFTFPKADYNMLSLARVLNLCQLLSFLGLNNEVLNVRILCVVLIPYCYFKQRCVGERPDKVILIPEALVADIKYFWS